MKINESNLEKLRDDPEIKEIKNNILVVHSISPVWSEKLMLLESRFCKRVKELLKPSETLLYSRDWYMTIWFKSPENWRTLYWFLDQEELDLLIEPKFSCVKWFTNWIALVQDPETLIWSAISHD